MVLCLLLLVGCKKNKGAESVVDGRSKRDTAVVQEKCDIASKGAVSVDANGDGKPDIVQVKSGGREVCRTADLNFDGRLDRITFFDANGKIRRVESDFDRDGRIDELAFFDTGTLKEKHRATTLDGKLDTWEFYEKGQVARTERDENGDGFIDQWWEYPSRGCPLIHMDTDGDGRPDPGASIDYCKETGYSPPPLPNEEKGPEKPADFGKSPQRVIETDSTGEDESSTDGVPAESAEEGAEPAATEEGAEE